VGINTEFQNVYRNKALAQESAGLYASTGKPNTENPTHDGRGPELQSRQAARSLSK